MVHCVVRGGWVGRSVRGSLFFAVSRFIRTNQLTASRVPGVNCCTYCCTAVLMYVPLHCCSAVLYVLLHCCSDVRTAALLFCCM